MDTIFAIHINYMITMSTPGKTLKHWGQRSLIVTGTALGDTSMPGPNSNGSVSSLSSNTNVYFWYHCTSAMITSSTASQHNTINTLSGVLQCQSKASLTCLCQAQMYTSTECFCTWDRHAAMPSRSKQDITSWKLCCLHDICSDRQNIGGKAGCTLISAATLAFWHGQCSVLCNAETDAHKWPETSRILRSPTTATSASLLIISKLKRSVLVLHHTDLKQSIHSLLAHAAFPHTLLFLTKRSLPIHTSINKAHIHAVARNMPGQNPKLWCRMFWICF